MNTFDRFIHALTWRTSQIGQIALAVAMFIIVANVILRIPWKPVPGTVEIVELSGAVLYGMGIAYCAVMRGHIMVGVLVDRFTPRVQSLIEMFTTVLTMYVTFLLSRELFVFAERMMTRGYTTTNLQLPVYPAIYLVAIGFVILFLVLIRDLLKAAVIAIKGSDTA